MKTIFDGNTRWHPRACGVQPPATLVQPRCNTLQHPATALQLYLWYTSTYVSHNLLLLPYYYYSPVLLPYPALEPTPSVQQLVMKVMDTIPTSSVVVMVVSFNWSTHHESNCGDLEQRLWFCLLVICRHGLRLGVGRSRKTMVLVDEFTTGSYTYRLHPRQGIHILATVCMDGGGLQFVTFGYHLQQIEQVVERNRLPSSCKACQQ